LEKKKSKDKQKFSYRLKEKIFIYKMLKLYNQTDMHKTKSLLGIVALMGILSLGACVQQNTENIEVSSINQNENMEAAQASASAKTYVIDTENSTFAWNAKKVLGAHDGFIKIKSGSFSVKDSQIESGKFVIDMTSISNTDLEGDSKEMLLNHLKSDDFFMVENFPESTFEITSTQKNEDGTTKISGNLTIKGITKNLSFNAKINLEESKAMAEAEFQIDRTEFDIRFRSGKFFTDLGDKAIEDMFTIKLNIVANS
jgi:polyisoprenoid-binding protein YceI